MGYRNYLGRIKKSKYDKSKMKDWEYRNKNIEEFYELGKHIDQDLVDNLIYIKKFNSEDCEYSIIDVESIPKIVAFYAQKHLDFLKKLLVEKPVDEKYLYPIANAEDFVKNQIENWETPKYLYNLQKDQENIVSSWEYQYLIFELVRIYKTFDAEKCYLTWTGH